MRPKHLVAILVLLALTLPASPAHASGVVSVCDEAHLLAALAGGGTVTFSCSSTITLTAAITIAADTTIDGSGQTITISGNDAVRVFQVNSGVTLNLNRLTIANGKSDYDAGGIFNLGTVNVSNSTFDGNSSNTNAWGSSAGGILNYGTLTVSNSVFSHNATCRAGGHGGGILNVDGGVLIVSNSVFTDNTADSGGGIANEGRYHGPGPVTVSNSTFAGNYGGSGGGGISNGGALTVTDSVFSGNSGVGGGILNGGSLAVLTVSNSTFAGNSTSHIGGGIFSQFSTTTVSNSTFSGNSAKYHGGGIGAEYSAVTVSNSTFSDNFANGYDGRGGGIYNNGGTVAVSNGTFSGNFTTSHEGKGGGIFSSGGTVTASNSTISKNSAQYGGGIHNSSGNVTLQNTILAGNTANEGMDCFGTIGSANYNLVGNTTGCSLTPGPGDQIGVDPKLGPLEGLPGYHMIRAGSPAIDAGNPGGCRDHLGNLLTTDQRGAPRVGPCDIGSVERQSLDDSSKSVNMSRAQRGMPIVYNITLDNSTTSDSNNILVTDTLPSLLTFQPNSLKAASGSYGFASGVITWTGTVSAGSTVAITFKAVVSQTALPGTSIVNTALIGSNGAQFGRSAILRVDDRPCNLTKYTGNPVLTPGANGTWDDAGVWGPTVLKEGNIYKMWYTGFDGTTSRIGYATSSDGIHWSKYSGPVWSSPQPAFAPAVRFDANTSQYLMDYTDASEIVEAYSNDGINWTRGDTILGGTGMSHDWDCCGALFPTALQFGGTFHLWYTGSDDATYRIGHAIGATRYPLAAVLDTGTLGTWDWLNVYGADVFRVGDELGMFYSGETLPPARQTAYATSPDGIHWTRHGVIIPTGNPGAFDSKGADHATAIVDADGFKVWYSGLNANGMQSIGFATAEICSTEGLLPGENTVYLPLVVKNYPCGVGYVEHFSDPASGWPVGDDSNRTYAYIGGEYQIRAKNPNQEWAVTPGAKATDFTVSVNAHRTSGNFGAYGLVFGINPYWTEYYEVLIDANFYSIWQYGYGNWFALRNWTISGAIATGTNWNRLKVVRNGVDIVVYINNQLVDTVSNDSLTGLRRIGLVAESDNTPLDARFDDFALYPVTCSGSVVGAGRAGETPEATVVGNQASYTVGRK